MRIRKRCTRKDAAFFIRRGRLKLKADNGRCRDAHCASADVHPRPVAAHVQCATPPTLRPFPRAVSESCIVGMPAGGLTFCLRRKSAKTHPGGGRFRISANVSHLPGKAGQMGSKNRSELIFSIKCADHSCLPLCLRHAGEPYRTPSPLNSGTYSRLAASGPCTKPLSSPSR